MVKCHDCIHQYNRHRALNYGRHVDGNRIYCIDCKDRLFADHKLSTRHG